MNNKVVLLGGAGVAIVPVRLVLFYFVSVK